MIRLAFNSGEMAPDSAVRPDLDVYHRGCAEITNFDVSQMGGLKRRRGMRFFADAQDNSRLFAYVYAPSLAFVVEVAPRPGKLRVYDADGSLAFEAASVWGAGDVQGLRGKQINSLFMLTCPGVAPYQLKRDDLGAWSLGRFAFKYQPWRHYGLRDQSISLDRVGDKYAVTFASGADGTANVGDLLRATVKVSGQSAFGTADTIWGAWMIVSTLSASSSVDMWRRVCINKGAYWEWWTCVKAFSGFSHFVAGKTSPGDYPDHFQQGAPVGADLTSRGTWKFMCSGEWYGEYAVERRYPGGAWELLGKSMSTIGSASNIMLTGDESGEECYLRLRLYQSKVENASSPTTGFVPDSCGNKLVVDSYNKDVQLRLGDTSSQSSIQSFAIYLPEGARSMFQEGVTYTLARLYLGGSAVAGAAGTFARGGNYLYTTPTAGVTPANMWQGQLVGLSWDVASGQVNKTFHVSSEAYHDSRYYFPGGGRILCSFRDIASASGTVVIRAMYVRDGTSWEVYRREGLSDGQIVDYSPAPNIDCVYVVQAYTNSATTVRFVFWADVWAGTGNISGSAEQVAIRTQAANYEIASPIWESCPSRTSTKDWSWCAWSSKHGFPALCDVFQSRLVFAGTRAQPQTVWLSRTDDLDNFDSSSDDDGAIAMTLSTTTQAPIRWMMAQGARLLLGTADAEFVASGDGSGVITAANVFVSPHGFYGSDDVPVIHASDRCLYIERGGGRCMQYGYDYEVDGYVSRDVTVFAAHMLPRGGGVVDGVMIRVPDPRVAYVLADGSVSLMTYNTMHRINAWHRYTTDGTVRSMCVLPNGGGDDLLFFTVERTYGETTRRFIERMDPHGEYEDNGGRGYVSTMLTNPLDAPESMGMNKQVSPVQLCFGQPLPPGGWEVTNNGASWSRPDCTTTVQGYEWRQVHTKPDWSKVVRIGFRVSGNRGCQLLAIQV